MKPAGIDRTPLRQLRPEHARILIIAIENWVFDSCSVCGQRHCTDWYLDLFEDRAEDADASQRKRG